MRQTCVCLHCGNEFLSRYYGKDMYCSQQCYGLASVVNHVEAFWDKVEKTVDCWNWTAACMNSGYGVAWDGAKVWTAHRLSWFLANGPIPKGLHVLHKCDNRKCVNPDHLFLGTNADNISDRVQKGRSNRTARARGELHGCAKLSEAQVRKIKASTDGLAALSRAFGVSRQTIFRIRKGHIWKHVGD